MSARRGGVRWLGEEWKVGLLRILGVGEVVGICRVVFGWWWCRKDASIVAFCVNFRRKTRLDDCKRLRFHFVY